MSSTKKKFGKNLNKQLSKPAAPPIAGAGARGSTSSRNGLLLLSTKRSSSSSNAGMLSSKASPSKPMQPLGVTTESYSSAHDALLGAVIGASQTTDVQQPPDAWGVAEKQASSSPPEEARTLAPKGGVSSGVSSYSKEGVESVEQKAQSAEVSAKREERARLEEERFSEQKDRAAQRLRELEKRMAQKSTANTAPMSMAQRSAPVPLSVAQRTNEDDKPVTLEPLGGGTHQQQQPTAVKGEPLTARTLFDPDRPYSSTVGGGGRAVEEKETRQSRETKTSSPVPPAAREEEQQATPVIHVSSYEDRDRGEDRNSSAPRMLFDPKSGSMVAVPSRGEEPSSGRSKRGGGKPKGRGGEGGLRKGRGRKSDDTQRKRGDADVFAEKESKARGRKPRDNRLPRTCGVLYVKDESGNCYCADGCDGDQGYGSHSVRGGRVRNPDDYAKFVEERKSYQKDESYDYNGYEEYGQEQKEPASNKKEKEIDWVKPNEKIELVTGVDDSPSLQATASPWAPSQAAIAAAAAAKEHAAKEELSPKPTVDRKMSTDEDEDEDDDHPQSFVGLGFDPTENMDAVMQSPSSMLATTSDRLEAVELSHLALDPSTIEPTSRNLFGIGSSSTWGTGAAGADWAVGLSNGTNGGTAANEEGGAAAASFLSLSTPASNNNPWGTPGLSGFGASTEPSSTGD